MRSLGVVAALAAIWALLWGSASAANVLSGVAIGIVLVLVLPGLRQRGRSITFRPAALARFAGVIVANTVRSNIELIREVLARQSRLHTAVVGVPLPECSDELVTLIANLLALTPGTMPIELRRDPTVLYVHVLFLRDVEAVRDEILHLTDLAVRAFGTPEQRAP